MSEKAFDANFVDLGDFKLTGKQELFVREYLVDRNATGAALRAGYSTKSATEQGYENLRKPHVQKAIKHMDVERLRKLNIDASDLLRKLVDFLYADISDICTDDGQLKSVNDWPSIWLRMANVKMRQEKVVLSANGVSMPGVKTITEVQVDKTKLIELIGKHIDVGAFQKRKMAVESTCVIRRFSHKQLGEINWQDSTEV